MGQEPMADKSNPAALIVLTHEKTESLLANDHDIEYWTLSER